MRALPLALAATLGLASTALADSESRVADQLTERGRFLVGGTVSGFYVRGGGGIGPEYAGYTTLGDTDAFGSSQMHFGVRSRIAATF